MAKGGGTKNEKELEPDILFTKELRGFYFPKMIKGFGKWQHFFGHEFLPFLKGREKGLCGGGSGCLLCSISACET